MTDSRPWPTPRRLPGATRHPAQATTTPATASFAAEQERIFEATWFCAVRVADLAAPGRFRKVQVGRESVLVVRGRDGLLRAFLNVCRHRGAQLCTEDPRAGASATCGARTTPGRTRWTAS